MSNTNENGHPALTALRNLLDRGNLVDDHGHCFDRNAAVGAARAAIPALEALLVERDALREALTRLCTPPEGSQMILGAHDRGPHCGDARDAWDAALDLLAKLDKGEEL